MNRTLNPTVDLLGLRIAPGVGECDEERVLGRLAGRFKAVLRTAIARTGDVYFGRMGLSPEPGDLPPTGPWVEPEREASTRTRRRYQDERERLV